MLYQAYLTMRTLHRSKSDPFGTMEVVFHELNNLPIVAPDPGEALQIAQSQYPQYAGGRIAVGEYRAL